MNKFIEDENILTFRKKSFDVSNVSVERLEKAEIIWNREQNIQLKKEHFYIKDKSLMSDEEIIEYDKEKLRVEKINIKNSRKRSKSLDNMTHRVALLLIRQDFETILFRMPFKEAVKEYFARLFLTTKYIKKSDKETEYEKYLAWLLFKMTGKKKAIVEMQQTMSESSAAIMITLVERGCDLEQCQNALLTFLSDQEKAGNLSEKSPSV